MIGYITFGSNNVSRAADFYQQLFDILGAERVYDLPSFVGWKISEQASVFSITTPHNQEQATFGNGTMVALEAPSTETVDRIHKLAIELGGTDEGQPGNRGSGFYCGYFRDLDGNKLNVFKKT